MTLAQALKSAANAIGNLKKSTHLTRFFKRIAYRKGRKEAIAATANKPAVIIYNMLTKFQQYRPYNPEGYEEKERKRELKRISKIVQRYGIKVEELIPIGYLFDTVTYLLSLFYG